MSKIVHPYAHRITILRGWKSSWFAEEKKYKDFLRADVLIRKFLEKKLRGFYVSLIEIERNQKSNRIIIKTSRPGMIIGRSGEGAIKLKEDLLKNIFLSSGCAFWVDLKKTCLSGMCT